MNKYMRLTFVFVIVFMLFIFCGCSVKEKEPRTYTEMQGNITITYTYDEYNASIVSKNIYNTDTGLTTEYSYFYEDLGLGDKLIGISVVIIGKDGQIIDSYGHNVN